MPGLIRPPAVNLRYVNQYNCMDFKQLMKQPDLGKKIVELRKAKGLTQEELVGKCNLNVRTLQRIEAGEVTPRSYTVRTIFAALGLDLHDVADSNPDSYREEPTGSPIKNWLEQFYRYSIDLFNLRTNTMKKISILTVITCALGFGLITIFTDGNAQSAEKVKKIIEETNEDFVHWFNNGQLDSVVSIYDKNACLVGHGCGEEVVRAQYAEQMVTGQKFITLETLSVTVENNTAVEKGRFTVAIHSQEIAGEFLTEWKYINKKWKIVSDAATVTSVNGAGTN